MKKLLLFLSILLCFGFAAVALAGDVDVDLVCPTNVTTGSPLSVTVYAYNWDCNNSVTVNRAMSGLGGNSGGSIGSAGMWGPYNETIGNRIIPAATCVWPTAPGELIPPARVRIVDAVPASLANTVAVVFFELLTSDGKSMGGDGCMVNVSPAPVQ
jgi:hypothetical protein